MVEFVARYAKQRRDIWPEIAAFFIDLPASLQTVANDFGKRLARGTSSTDELKDAFLDPALSRIVYLPLWFIESYRDRGIDPAETEWLGRELFVSSFMMFCAVRIQDDLVDGDKPEISIDELILANLFSLESVRRLQRCFSADSSLWDYHRKHWFDYSQAIGVEKERDLNGLARFDDVALRALGDKAAPLKTYPIAVLLKAGKAHEIDRVEKLMDSFSTAVQLHNDLQSLRCDMEHRHYTNPISEAALMVGYEEGSHPPIDGLYGAVVMTNAVVRAHQVARRHYEAAQEVCRALAIEDLATHLAWHLDLLGRSEKRWQRLLNIGRKAG